MADLNALRHQAERARRRQADRLAAAEENDRLAQRAADELRRLQKEIERAERPRSPRSHLITFSKRYDGRGVLYSYAGIRVQTAPAINKRWFITGMSQKAYTWVELLEFIGRDYWHTIKELVEVDELREVDEVNDEFETVFPLTRSEGDYVAMDPDDLVDPSADDGLSYRLVDMEDNY